MSGVAKHDIAPYNKVVGRFWAQAFLLAVPVLFPAWLWGGQAAWPTVSGFLQFQGLSDRSDLAGRPPGPDSTRDTWAFKRARLAFSGAADGKTGYNVMLGGESGVVSLFNAFLDREVLERRLSLRVGQFKVPFGLEAYESGHKRPLVVMAEATEGVAKKLGSLGGNFRDVGLQAGGSFGPSSGEPWALEYAFAVVNGSGPLTNGAKDNNDAKDLVARLQLTRGADLLGACAHAGRAEPQGSSVPMGERSYGLYAQGSWPRAWFRAEYLSAFYQNARGDGADTNPLGWYVLAAARLPRALQLLLRYEDWQANRLLASGHLGTTTLGLAWDASPAVNLKLNYLFRDAQANAAAPADGTKAAGARIGDLLAFQVQGSF